MSTTAASSSAAAASSSAMVDVVPILAAQPASAASQAEVMEQLAKFTDSFQAKALRIIYEVIPAKVDTLQSILDRYQTRPCDAPRFTPMGAHCNKSIQEVMVEIKVEIHALLALLDPLRMWVVLNIPKIQDQKGIPIQVKEDLVEMLHTSKLSALSLFENMAKFHVGRGKLVSKMVKFPMSQDHAICITELDKKQYFLLLNMVSDIKNNYSLIYDSCIKNMDKIVRQTDLESYHIMY